MVAIKDPLDLRYDEVMGGRMLRVQYRTQTSELPVEIVGVYAPPVDDYNPSDAKYELRQKIWHCLDKVLSEIPKRHLLVLMGDFNVKIPRQLPEVACDDPSRRTSADSADMLALLLRHELLVQNCRAGRAGITYRSCTSSTPRSGVRIDYIIIRRSMKSCCTATSVLWSVPYLAPNSFGWHAVLSGGISLRWRCWRRRLPPTRKRVIDKEKITAAQDVSHPLHSEFMNMMRSQLDSCDSTSFGDVSKLVLDCSMAVFGRDPSPRPHPHWMDSNLRSLCLKKWKSFHEVRDLSTPTGIDGFFRCWHAVSKLLCHSRRYKQMSKKARTSWVHQVCEDAAAKANANDPRFYRCIRLLSPKKPLKLAGIRKMLSGAQTLEEEGSSLYGYFAELFGAPSAEQHLTWKSWNWISSCPPSEDALAEYLSGLPMHKAVPSQHATGAAWRLALRLPQVRSCIHRLVVRFPHDGVHQPFRDGKLLLLPKPGKAGKLIEHYRPLVLQCPLGKMLLRYFVDRLVSEVKSRILGSPQYAYLGGRSTHMAIQRVGTFLMHRKTLAGSPQLPPHLLRAGFVAPTCTGCLVVSIDLRQAFDRVNGLKLMEYMEGMQLSDDLLGVFRSWHINTRYFLDHGAKVFELLSSRGVRQGCTAAPVLWLIYLYNILLGLRELAPINWDDIVTAFADDLIFTFPIDDVEDISLVLSYARKLLDFLRGHGLEVNLDKTQFLFKLYGSKTCRHWQQHTYMDGGRRRLRLTSSFHPYLSDTLEYLGVVLSWRNCGDAVLQHRMNKAKGAFSLLTPWWRTALLSSRCKAKLYKTMVLPVLMYGLGASGISDKGLARFKKLMIRQLRCIFRSPVHLSRETDLSFLNRIGFLLPSVYVMVECCKIARQLLPEVNSSALCGGKGVDFNLALHCSSSTSWLRCVHAGLCILLPDCQVPDLSCMTAPMLRHLLAGIPRRHLHHGWLLSRCSPQAPSPASMGKQAPLPVLDVPHTCHACGREFASFNRLRSHQYGQNCGWTEKETNVFISAVDSRTELPTCFWCGAKFLRWQGIKMHIELGQCPASHLRKEFLAQSTCTMTYHLDQDLRHHCVICRRWFKFPRSLSCHLKAAHRQDFDRGQDSYNALDLTRAYASVACIACGHVSKSCNRMHHLHGRCMVILQRCGPSS